MVPKRRNTFAAGAILILQCCTPTPARDRGDVAQDLQQRTGANIRPEGEPAPPSIPAGVSVNDGLTSNETVALALWNSAEFQAALVQLQFEKADLVAAGALPNPTFSLLFPLGPKQLEANLGWDLSWLWQRPHRVKLANLNLESVAADLVQYGLDTAWRARLAHAELLRAQDHLEMVEQAAATQAQIVKLNEVALAVGTSNELALTGVRADARMAEVEVQRRRHDIDVARAELQQLVGVDAAQLQATEETIPQLSHALDDLVKQALAARPDARAAELMVQVAGQRCGLENAEIFQFQAILDANGEGSQGFEMGPGLGLTLPLFNQNKAGKARARAELEQASWHYLAVRQRIASEVKAAYARLVQALEALEVWPKQVLEPVEATLKLANAAFQAGESHLVVLDATRRLITARAEQVQLEADARKAWAELSRSVGRKLDAPSE